MLTVHNQNEYCAKVTGVSSARKLMARTCLRRKTIVVKDKKKKKKKKKFGVCGEVDVERRLFRVFRLACKRDIGFHFDKFYAKLLRLAEVWRCSNKLKAKLTRSWLTNWCAKYGIVDKDERSTKEEQQSISTRPECTSQTGKSDLEETLDHYSEDEIYLFFCFHFSWSSLPDRTLGAERNVEDNVWLLMAANRSGRHRTRVCLLGKEPKPMCLQHVNMLSQPVVYSSFEGDSVTSDLFAWWFYHEFSPGALAINRKVALLVEARSHLNCNEFVSEDSRAKFLLVEKDAQMTESTWPREKNVVQMEFRVRYAKLFFSLILVEEPNWSCQTFISRWTLKDVFPLLHEAWLTIRIETFERHFNELLSVTDDRGHGTAATATATSSIYTEDGKLLLELQWIAHDLGLEISDQDLVKWAYTGEVLSTPIVASEAGEVKKKIRMPEAVNVTRIPTAREASVYLTKALAWMETEPLDPHFLLFIRHLIVLAKQARNLTCTVR